MTLAIVKAPDGATYVSPLLALKFDGLRSLAVGLDGSHPLRGAASLVEPILLCSSAVDECGTVLAYAG